MKNIQQTYTIAATPDEVWRALTAPELIEVWSGADAEFEPTVGVAYSLWDGSIGGEIIEVVPHQKLVQSWQPEDWTIEDSVVTFTLSPVKDGTRVDLFHENVEEFDFEGTTEGWDVYYLGAIKRMFEGRTRNTKTTKGTKAAKGSAKKTKGTKTAKGDAKKAKATKASVKRAKGAKKGKVVAKRKVAAKKVSKKK